LRKRLRDDIEGTEEELKDLLTYPRDISRVDQGQLERSLESLAEARQIVNGNTRSVVVEGNVAAPGSLAIFGTDNQSSFLSLSVSGNVAETGSTLVAGVHSPQTLRNLLMGGDLLSR
jgi:hypothetical protein